MQSMCHTRPVPSLVRMPKVKGNPKIPKTPPRVRNYEMGSADFVPKNRFFAIFGITMVFVFVALQLCMGVRLSG